VPRFVSGIRGKIVVDLDKLLETEGKAVKGGGVEVKHNFPCQELAVLPRQSGRAVVSSTVSGDESGKSKTKRGLQGTWGKTLPEITLLYETGPRNPGE